MILTETLKTRPTPRQARARERIRMILQATADLLQHAQPEKLTTTMIADQGNFPVSSIYRYFPSVDDVLRELYLQTAGEVRTILFAELSGPGPWRKRLRTALALQHDYMQTHPFYRPLMLAFLSHRGPIAIEDEEHRELVRFLEHRWSQGMDGFSGGNAAIVAQLVIQIALSVEDMASTNIALAPALTAEAYVILEAYLSRYLSDDPAA